jgi:hypothetical protein
MNIVQAYTKFNKQFIILVSGFSGSNKTKLAKFLSGLFGFQLVGLNKFYFTENEYASKENYVTLKTGLEVLNWDNIYKSVDWDKFNDYINSIKDNGVVIYGFGFPTNLLKFKSDYHIHVLVRKQKLIENRSQFIEKHTNENFIKNSEDDKLYLNTIVYPLYINIKKDSKIDEYVSSDEMTEDEMKDSVFKYLMSSIKSWLNEYNSSLNTDKGYKKEKGKNKSNKKKPMLHDDDNEYYYDEFYYPDKKRVLYDFNDEGIDYPDEFREKFNADKESTSSIDSDSDSDLNTLEELAKSKKKKISSSSSDDSTATFLFTRRAVKAL